MNTENLSKISLVKSEQENTWQSSVVGRKNLIRH